VNLLLVPSYPAQRGVSTSFVADLVKYVRDLFADAALHRGQLMQLHHG